MIIGTAGHIDHGKSALVTALTGRPVDRLEEERRRGITIDLNFAPLELAGLPPIGMIDVPGHEDLIRTMVAGASGIDLVLLVIDLAEGPRPQTEEHLAILEQLAVPAGIPVFTKADLVEPDWSELVVAEAMTRLGRSTIRFDRPAVVSAVTGAGIDELRGRLEAWIRGTAERPTTDLFRMPIDRAFSKAGIGTIVTGTPWSGSVALGDEVTILPGGQRGRVRSVEAYGRARAATAPATRTALGIAGIERAEVRRGDVAVTGSWEPSTALDATVTLLASAPAPLRTRSRVRLHLGTAEVLARVVVSGGGAIEPGQSGLVRLVLESPLLARGGDRLVIRSYSPVATIGGGAVIDPLPPRRSRPDPGLADPGPVRLATLVGRRRFGLPVSALSQVTGSPAANLETLLHEAGLIRIGGQVVAPGLLDAIRGRIVEEIREHHRVQPAERGLSVETVRSRIGAPEEITDRVLADLARKGTVRSQAGLVALAGFTPSSAGGAEAVATVVRFLDQRGLEIATMAEIAEATGLDPVGPAVRGAVEAGQAAAVDRERYASTAALDGFRRTLAELGAAGEITPASVRDRLGLTRKYLIPLLEWADRQGVTRRVGDVRLLVQNGR